MRRIMLAGAAACLAVVGLGAGMAAAGPQNTILIDRDSGAPGDVVGVRNTPGETCGVTGSVGTELSVELINEADETVTTAQGAIEPNGAWRLPDGLVISDDAVAGEYLIQARCNPGGGGFDYTPAPFTVTEAPVSTTTTAATLAPTETESAEPGPTTDTSLVAPRADIGLLLIFGTLIFVITIIGGWWIWRQILTSVTRAVPLLRMMGWITIIGAILFTASWIIGGLVQDGYGEKREYISALGAPGAKYSWIMVLGFLVGGISLVLGAFAGHGGLENCGVRAKGPTFVLGFAGAMMFDLALYRSDCSRARAFCAEADTSWHHDWHTIVGWVTVLSLIVAAFWFAQLFIKITPCRKISWWSLGGGVLMLCGPLFLLEVIDKNGLTQRNFLLAAAAFVAYLGWEMARRARPPGAPGDEQLAGGPQSSGGSQTYGDEKPLPPEDRSEAWRENRRSETTL